MHEVRKYTIQHPAQSDTYFGPYKSETAFSSTVLPETDTNTLLETLRLPLPSGEKEVVAFGEHSIAFRFQGLSGEKLIGVVRYPGKETSIDAELKSIELSSKMRAALEGFATPVWHVLTEDSEQEALTLKVSPEVQGGTLDSLGVLHLLGNPQALKSYVALCKQLLKLSLQSATFDVAGQKGVEKFLPFVSKNIVLQLGTDFLSAVDIEVLEEHQKNTFDNPKGAAKLLLHFSSTAVSALVAAGMSTLLEQVIQRTESKKKDNSKEHIHPEESLQKIITVLEGSELEYRIVGGFAFGAHLQKAGVSYELSAERADGSTRDVDIFVLSKQDQKTAALEEQLDATLAKLENPLEVSIQYVGEEEAHTIRTGTHLQDDGTFLLKYEDIQQELPAETFEAVALSYSGVTFQTVPLATLIGQTLSRQGSVPLQDLAKIGLCYEAYPDTLIRSEYTDLANKIRAQKNDDYRRWMKKQWLYLLLGKRTRLLTGTVKKISQFIRRS